MVPSMNNEDILKDHKNLALLRLLEQNPRAPISHLARRIVMSNPAAKERIFSAWRKRAFWRGIASN